MNIHLGWWIIPTAITVLAIWWPFHMARKDDGLFGGFTLVLFSVPALALIAVTWLLVAVFK